MPWKDQLSPLQLLMVYNSNKLQKRSFPFLLNTSVACIEVLYDLLLSLFRSLLHSWRNRKRVIRQVHLLRREVSVHHHLRLFCKSWCQQICTRNLQQLAQTASNVNLSQMWNKWQRLGFLHLEVLVRMLDHFWVIESFLSIYIIINLLLNRNI